MERVGWVFMGLLLVAGLLGLFGSGPFSRATAGQRGSDLWVEYNRFDRYEAPFRLKVHLGQQLASRNSVALSINREFLEKTELEYANPEPESFEATPVGAIYNYKLAQTNGPVTFLLQFRAIGYGAVPVRLSLDGGSNINFQQFFYP